MSFDPYSVFDVPQSADFETLRAIYRRLARENHPDIASDKLAATARMAQINRAWAILGDETKRATFDAELRLRNSENQRREDQQREIIRREAAQREIARVKARRVASNAPQKKSQRASNAPSGASNGATSKGASKRNPKSATEGAMETGTGGASNPRNNHSRTDKSKSRASGTRPRDQKTRETGSKMARVQRESRISDPSNSNSPRALRLMRKVTLASRIWHRDGNAGGAIDMCRAVLLADGRNVPARELLSEIFAAQNRMETALMMLDQAIQIAPDDRLLLRKRQHLQLAHLQLAHSGASAPRRAPRATRRLTLWQRLRARWLKR